MKISNKNESLYGKPWMKPTTADPSKEIIYGRPSNKKPANAVAPMGPKIGGKAMPIQVKEKDEDPPEISKLLFGGYDKPFDPKKKAGTVFYKKLRLI